MFQLHMASITGMHLDLVWNLTNLHEVQPYVAHQMDDDRRAHFY